MLRAVCPKCKRGVIVEDKVKLELIKARAKPGDIFPHPCPMCKNPHLVIAAK